MSENIFDAIPHESKRLITFENSDHLFAFWDEQDRYIAEIFSYIEEYLN